MKTTAEKLFRYLRQDRKSESSDVGEALVDLVFAIKEQAVEQASVMYKKDPTDYFRSDRNKALATETAVSEEVIKAVTDLCEAIIDRPEMQEEIHEQFRAIMEEREYRKDPEGHYGAARAGQ